MKFAGIVVTYNRKEDLERNLLSVAKQIRKLDKYYIIDNCSTDSTFDYLNNKNLLGSEIEYISLKENIGGAGGFYTGLKRAYDDGYDFVCMMDDDGRPLNENTFAILFKACEKLYIKNKLLMINSLVLCNEETGELSFGLKDWRYKKDIDQQDSDGILYGYINPFNGTVVSRKLIEKIGYVNKDFFIRGDEVDYQSRAQKAGAIIATVVESLYFHPSSDLVPMMWRGRKINVGICSPWKSYYLVRNYIYRIKRDEGIINAVKEFIFQWEITRRTNPEYRNCRKFLKRGFIDGIRGRLGKRVNPGDM